MGKKLRIAAIACLCACLAFVIAGCSSPAPSKSSTETLSVSEKTNKAVEPSKDPYYVLVVGNDTRYGTIHGEGIKEDDPSYSDTMMLVRVDPTTYRISVVSIPRDTAYVLDGKETKINDIHHEKGIDALVEQVETLFGVKVSYYFDTTFAQFEDFINKLGGVTVNVPVDMSWSDEVHGGKIYLKAGENQTLDGPQALVFSRMRKQYPDNGDACRQQNGRQVVCSGIAAVASRPESEAEMYAQFLEDFSKSNMPVEQLTADIKQFQRNHDKITFQTGSGPWHGAVDGTGDWRVPMDTDTYKVISEAMVSGAPITDIVANPM